MCQFGYDSDYSPMFHYEEIYYFDPEERRKAAEANTVKVTQSSRGPVPVAPKPAPWPVPQPPSGEPSPSPWPPKWLRW